MRVLDYLAIAIAVAVTVLAAATAYGTPVSNPIVQIRAGGKILLYPLNTDRVIAPLDDPESCRIAIESDTVRVVSSNCPQRICVSMGAINSSGQWIACLPHKVFIDFVAGPAGRVDAQTF